MAKIKNDKYYTPPELAEYVVNKTKEIIGEDNISEWLEPSAGSGVFLDYLPDNVLAYDIEPEDEKGRIAKQDYLSLELEYKKGRCVIGNPPFGVKNTLSVQFYKKSVLICDYIVFILPISQLNNNQQMYEFDLMHSEDLGKKNYSDIRIHCCLNIFKRNKNGLNKKLNYKLKDVIIAENRRGGSKNIPDNYDIAICGWGASIGKEIKHEGQYANEKYIIINKHKDKVINILRKVNWVELYSMTATPALYQWQIYKYIKEQIPEIE